MSTKVWVLRSFIIVQITTALKILPQAKKVDENSQEPALLKVLNDIHKTESVVPVKRRSFIERMLLGSLNQGSKSKHPKANKNYLHQRAIAAEPELSPQLVLQAQRDEEELVKLSQDVSKSALLHRPYIEKKGRNDFLVLQSDKSDPFVTVIPNSIYYEVEKKCVNWLDACSLRGIRAHLLERVQSPSV